MTLTIDKKQIEFTLEGEKFLDEIIHNINNWLGENQLIIEKLFINNEDYSQKDLKVSLDAITNIDIETISFKDLNIDNITWIKYFFENLNTAIKDWNLQILQQVKPEIPFVLENLPIILSIDSKTPDYSYNNTLNNLLEKYEYFQCKENIVNKDEITSYIDNLIILLTERLNEFCDTKNVLKASIEVLNSLQEELESVSIYLQSNKANKASEIMNKFTNIFHKILRMIKFNINNPEFVKSNELDEFTDGLDEILTELLEGYESQDTVLIGDILEYELSSKIDILKEYFT